jgi:hypothetical protein
MFTEQENFILMEPSNLTLTRSSALSSSLFTSHWKKVNDNLTRYKKLKVWCTSTLFDVFIVLVLLCLVIHTLCQQPRAATSNISSVGSCIETNLHSWVSASRPMPPASAFRHLSPVQDHSCTGLEPLIWHRTGSVNRIFFSFRHRTDRIPVSPAFRHIKNILQR